MMDCPRCASPTLEEDGHAEIRFCYRCRQLYRVQDGELVLEKARTPEKQAQRQETVSAAQALRPKRGGTAVRTEVDGLVFASKTEARRYQSLVLLQASGEISQLETKTPACKFPFVVNGLCIGQYEADFVYWKGGCRIVEDSKSGVVTAIYRLKKKLMKAIYDIEIMETK